MHVSFRTFLSCLIAVFIIFISDTLFLKASIIFIPVRHHRAGHFEFASSDTGIKSDGTDGTFRTALSSFNSKTQNTYSAGIPPFFVLRDSNLEHFATYGTEFIIFLEYDYPKTTGFGLTFSHPFDPAKALAKAQTSLNRSIIVQTPPGCNAWFNQYGTLLVNTLSDYKGPVGGNHPFTPTTAASAPHAAPAPTGPAPTGAPTPGLIHPTGAGVQPSPGIYPALPTGWEADATTPWETVKTNPKYQDYWDITPTANPIEFYESTAPNYEFTNFFTLTPPIDIDCDGRLWVTSEHYFQAQKFINPATQEQIRILASPGVVFDAARRKVTEQRPDWFVINKNVMLKALRVKFQNDPLKTKLLSTGQSQLIEHTHPDTDRQHHDTFWGIGLKTATGNLEGTNWLGRLLMLVRYELRHPTTPPTSHARPTPPPPAPHKPPPALHKPTPTLASLSEKEAFKKIMADMKLIPITPLSAGTAIQPRAQFLLTDKTWANIPTITTPMIESMSHDIIACTTDQDFFDVLTYIGRAHGLLDTEETPPPAHGTGSSGAGHTHQLDTLQKLLTLAAKNARVLLSTLIKLHST